LQICIDNESDAVQRSYMVTATQASERMLRVINGLFYLSQIESGHVQIASIPVDLRNLMLEVSEHTADLLQSKPVRVSWILGPRVPRHVLGDPDRLRQVLMSLCANAAQFTQAGEIEISCLLNARSEGGLALQFIVKDTGVGIPPVDAEGIFTAHKELKVDGSGTFAAPGYGLAISRRLIELMGGEVWLETEVGKGTTAHFLAHVSIDPDAAPITADNMEDASRSPAIRDAWQVAGAPWGARVLVVEDNPVNRLVTRELLKSHHVDHIAHARRAPGRVGRRVALVPAVYGASQRDIAVTHCDGDLSGVCNRCALQRCLDVRLDCG
jgi:anti-sigma regulatory factor (Ser/Thr protein kinase)